LTPVSWLTVMLVSEPVAVPKAITFLQEWVSVP
jgi:hypothetical protein